MNFSAEMKQVTEAIRLSRRLKFEEEALPHLGALWGTAQLLTQRAGQSEEMVSNTMTQAYRSWHSSTSTVGSKVRLFRMLVREALKFGTHERLPSRFLEENVASGSKLGDAIRRQPAASIDSQELSSLSGFSSEFVRRTIAGLRPPSRLMLILLYRERFSYSEIAYITDLTKESVKSILTRLRRLIPRYLVRHVDHSVIKSQRSAVSKPAGAPLASPTETLPKTPLGLAVTRFGVLAAVDCSESEGGALLLRTPHMRINTSKIHE